MNRTKLDALLRAGLITLAEHQAGVASIDNTGRVTELPQLQLRAPASVRLETGDLEGEEEAPEWDGSLSGIVTAYGVLVPSHGMILEPGCLVPRQPLSANKMMRDHDHSQPVGYMLDVDDANEIASFQIAPGERPRVQQEVDDKLRDGLSVGFTALEYDIDDDWVFHVIKADWYETSLCAVPAVVGAGVTSVAAALATLRKENRTMNRAQLAAALKAGTITQEQHDAALTTLDAVELATPAPPVDAETARGPELQATQPAAIVTERPLTLDAVTDKLVAAANTGNPAAFQLALADVIPADDAGQAFMRDDWEGELWRDNAETRPWIDAFGAPADLKSLTGKGWTWGEADESGNGGEPEVDEYAGNKTDIPTNEIGTTDKSFTGFRIAGGWDVDRAFVDFANEEFWAAFWPAAMRSYKRKSDLGIKTRVLTAATAKANVTAGGVKAVVKQLIKDVRPYGKLNRIFLGDTLFDELADLPTDTLPLWLKNAVLGVDIAEGTADVGQLRILNDSTLDDLDAVGFDNRAAKVRERSPFRLEAQNIPKGGVDVGIFSYLRLDDHDNRAIVKRTYAAA